MKTLVVIKDLSDEIPAGTPFVWDPWKGCYVGLNATTGTLIEMDNVFLTDDVASEYVEEVRTEP